MKSILKKKRFLFGLIAVIVLALLAFGGEQEADVGEEAEEEEEVSYVVMPENPVKMTGETISVYNWGDYIEPEVIDVFEAETGIRVIYETFETNEDMYAKIAMGGSSYDVIIPSDYMIERMIQEQLLQPINWENVPNVKNIDPRFTHESYDPAFAYSVPYTWGTMGVLYNKETVLEEPDSWNVLLDETYKMDMFMLNAPRDTMAIALVMAGYDLNSTEPEELQAAKELLIAQKPLVLAYVVDEVKDKMISGEASVALVWSGDATFCMSENEELGYVVPKEGSNIFYDSMCIPHNARNVSGAEKFIDFMCRADVAAANYNYVGYAIPNAAAIEVWGAEEYNASPVNNPPQEALDKCQVFRYLGDDTKLYDQIWTEIISEF
ncbi:MAG: ABC transporter substrate-binding protein [Clostridia bacterium]|nr:ABC transporter substrate-binding protein [Clostridia bacterium]